MTIIGIIAVKFAFMLKLRMALSIPILRQISPPCFFYEIKEKTQPFSSLILTSFNQWKVYSITLYPSVVYFMTTPFCEVASVPSCIIIIESYATLITIFLIATLYTPLLLPCMQMYECPPQ